MAFPIPVMVCFPTALALSIFACSMRWSPLAKDPAKAASLDEVDDRNVVADFRDSLEANLSEAVHVCSEDDAQENDMQKDDVSLRSDYVSI